MASPLAGAEPPPHTEIQLWAEAGTYNKTYQDRQFISTELISLPVPSWTLGGQFSWRDAGGAGAGFNLTQTWIAGAQTWNYDRQETQTETLVEAAGVFAAQDWTWWGIKLGLGWQVRLENRPASSYIQADGSLKALAGGWVWNRQASPLYPIGSVRFLPSEGFHLLLNVGVDDFNPVDSLIDLRGVFPLGPASQWWLAASLPPPNSYWQTFAGMLRSNQRLGFGWDTPLGPFQLGLKTGILLRPSHQDQDGEIGLWERLSLGISLKSRW